MAGHSKWANIKHKKDRVDKQKGKIFSRAAKEIISAVKLGGSDPKSNARLRLAIEKAKEANVPNDNIERNIKKASSSDQADYTEVVYELYGHGGVGMVVEAMTDNKNRTASEMRIATNKRGGSIAQPGSVTFNFERKGVIQVPKSAGSEVDLFAVAIESGATDFESEEENFMIITEPDLLLSVQHNLEKSGIVCQEGAIEMIPKIFVECDTETFKANIALVDWLEELDDVDSVYHNMHL